MKSIFVGLPEAMNYNYAHGEERKNVNKRSTDVKTRTLKRHNQTGPQNSEHTWEYSQGQIKKTRADECAELSHEETLVEESHRCRSQDASFDRWKHQNHRALSWPTWRHLANCREALPAGVGIYSRCHPAQLIVWLGVGPCTRQQSSQWAL